MISNFWKSTGFEFSHTLYVNAYVNCDIYKNLVWTIGGMLFTSFLETYDKNVCLSAIFMPLVLEGPAGD